MNEQERFVETGPLPFIKDGGECGTLHDPKTGQFAGSKPCSDLPDDAEAREGNWREPLPEEEDYYLNHPLGYPNLDDFMIDDTFGTMNNYYNCAADAFGDTDNWWWPSMDSLWPEAAREGDSVRSFDKLLTDVVKGKVTNDTSVEQGFIKLALMAQKKVAPTHIVRQLDNGKWQSKMGSRETLIVNDPSDLNGSPLYGEVIKYYKLPYAEWDKLAELPTNGGE